jgi:hypothetical protein
MYETILTLMIPTGNVCLSTGNNFKMHQMPKTLQNHNKQYLSSYETIAEQDVLVLLRTGNMDY